MKLRLNSRNGHKPVVLKPVPKPSPMNWRPQTAAHFDLSINTVKARVRREGW